MTDNPTLSPWVSSLNTGIKEIDEQHQTIYRLVEDIDAAIKREKDTDILDDLLGQLANYTRIHFSIEESLMRSLNYPDYEQHKGEHEMLLDQCMNIRGQIQAGDMTRMQLLELLNSWFSRHIMETDMGFSSHFQKAGAVDALKRMDWMSSLWQWRSNP